ncbi:MAG: cyanophycinase [Pseudomonadota bacterium]
MRAWLAVAAWAVVAAFTLGGPARADEGHLLIVGGGLSFDNEEVYRALLDNRPEDSPGIAIVAAATSEASATASTFAGELMFYGVEPEDIAIVSLAVVDDPDTPDVDESDWAANAADPGEIAKIENAGAIWFTGGDQLRLNHALIEPSRADSPMLAAIRARLRDGAIVGGTSAGAAAMSSPMIARGNAFGSLFGGVRDTVSEGSDDLAMVQGLRLFSPFILDQHFAERGRIGRLVRAIMTQPGPARIGIGIDEDTALLVDLAQNSAQVIGPGAVTLLDGRGAQRTVSISGFLIRGLRLSRLHDGDRLSLTDLDVRPDPARLQMEDRRRAFGGMWPSVESLSVLERETRTLHAGERHLRRSAIIDVRMDEGKRSVVFRFVSGRDSGYWRGPDDEGWSGTLTGIALSIDGHFSPDISPRP